MDVPGDDMFVTQARSFKVVQLSVSTLPPVLFSCSQNEDKNLPLSIQWGQGTEPQASCPEGKFSKGACGQYSSFKIMCNLIARLVPLCVPHWLWIYWKLSLKAYRWRNKSSINVGWLETKCWLIYIICCRVLMELSADMEYPGVSCHSQLITDFRTANTFSLQFGENRACPKASCFIFLLI